VDRLDNESLRRFISLASAFIRFLFCYLVASPGWPPARLSPVRWPQQCPSGPPSETKRDQMQNIY
jgi:hypothetical protein